LGYLWRDGLINRKIIANQALDRHFWEEIRGLRDGLITKKIAMSKFLMNLWEEIRVSTDALKTKENKALDRALGGDWSIKKTAVAITRFISRKELEYEDRGGYYDDSVASAGEKP